MLKNKLGNVQLVKLSALVLHDFIDAREAEGAGGVTITADLYFLSGALKWAYFTRHLNVPYELALAARAGLKHRKNLNTRSVERDREPTGQELDILYGYWRGRPRQNIDMPTVVKFALSTGMRLGEICRIRIEDINFTDKIVIIRDRKDPVNKVGNDQEVPLLPDAWSIVKQVVCTRERGRVFPYKAESVSAAFTRACKNLAIDGLHFHDLRHKATADLFRAGLDTPFVAIMTGHKTWAMLRRYTSIKAVDVHKFFLSAMPLEE